LRCGSKERAHIADLTAGVRVEAGSVENDFAGIAGCECADANAIFDQRDDTRAIDAECAVAFEFGFGKIAVDGGSGFLRATFPGGASALLFFGACALETFHIELDARIARSIDHEVERHTESFVEAESFTATQHWLSLLNLRNYNSAPARPIPPVNDKRINCFLDLNVLYWLPMNIP